MKNSKTKLSLLSILGSVMLFCTSIVLAEDDAATSTNAEPSTSTESSASTESSTSAESSASAESSTGQSANNKLLNPWIDCGIGAMFFADTSWAAASSNIIWDLGTTAVTSNSSSQNTCNSTKAKTAMFVGTTYANLEEETVKGKGEHLQVMLSMMGCESNSHQSIISNVRSGFTAQLQNPEYADKTTATKSEEYLNMVKATIDAKHFSQCNMI